MVRFEKRNAQHEEFVMGRTCDSTDRTNYFWRAVPSQSPSAETATRRMLDFFLVVLRSVWLTWWLLFLYFRSCWGCRWGTASLVGRSPVIGKQLQSIVIESLVLHLLHSRFLLSCFITDKQQTRSMPSRSLE